MLIVSRCILRAPCAINYFVPGKALLPSARDIDGKGIGVLVEDLPSDDCRCRPHAGRLRILHDGQRVGREGHVREPRVRALQVRRRPESTAVGVRLVQCAPGEQGL